MPLSFVICHCKAIHKLIWLSGNIALGVMQNDNDKGTYEYWNCEKDFATMQQMHAIHGLFRRRKAKYHAGNWFNAA